MRVLKSSKSRPSRTAAIEPVMPVSAQRPGNRDRNPGLEASFGARLRAARIAAQMSQGALGGAIGITFQQVQKYETGKDRIAASTLQGLAAVLGIHPASFFGDDMPVPSASTVEVRAAMRMVECLQRIRNPVVVGHLVALIDSLAAIEVTEDTLPIEHPIVAVNQTC